MRFVVMVFVFFLYAFWAHAEPGERLRNDMFGLSMEKASDWVTVSAMENRENLAKTKTNSEAFTDLLRTRSRDPIFVFARHPMDYENLNPSFKVGFVPRNNPNVSAEQVFDGMIQMYSKLLKNFKSLESGVASVGGVDGVHGAFSYILQAADGAEYSAISEIYLVPMEQYYLIVGLGYAPDSPPKILSDLHGMVNSIRFD